MRMSVGIEDVKDLLNEPERVFCEMSSDTEKGTKDGREKS